MNKQIVPLILIFGLILMMPYLAKWLPAEILLIAQAVVILWLGSTMIDESQIIFEMACLPVLLFQELTVLRNFKYPPVVTILYAIPFFTGHKGLDIWLLLLEAVLTIVVLTYAAYYSVYRRFYQAEELTQTNHKLNQANAKIAELTSQRVRQEIARDLHDTLTQDIVGINMQLAVVKHLADQQDYPKMRQMLERTEGMTSSAIKESRQLIQQYRKAAEDQPQRSLKQAIVRLINDMRENYQLQTKLQFTQDLLIENEKLHDISQVVREALMNVVKHGRTTQAAVEIHHDQKWLTILIIDHGRRFVPPTKLTNHFGLKNMNERAAKHGGQVTVESLDDGVKVVARFKLEEETL
ncbi:hypothetical protein FC35_GL000354 [Limosilactobacillus coleohominis DSM 14060]|nr:hypothetical protein FC35_GL000354 [Limosilactobacillus coleohominis DSM 14060]